MRDAASERRAAGERFRWFVRERMAAVGIRSQADLCRQADISRGTLDRWNNGDRISGPAGERLAAVLEVSYQDILDARVGRENGPSEALEEQVERGVERALRRVLDELRAAGVLDG